MKTKNEHLHFSESLMKPREGRIAPARSVRLAQAQQASFLYVEDRWGGLPPCIANMYARNEDKSKHAIRERSLM
ncbi:MAG: hypothetical protein JNN20_16435 [Betaproteobacteria bacterium]|nr:hypothetical protein [Betaproteobacteria bacterium]